MQATHEERSEAHRWVQDGTPAEKGVPRFSFRCEGRPSGELLPGWTFARTARKLDAGGTEHLTVYHDPRTGLEARWQATEHEDVPAVEAILYLRNRGSRDTPLIADVQPLDTLLPFVAGRCSVHYARGAQTSLDDFAPLLRVMGTPTSTLRVTAGGGRSSSEHLPFFNVEGDRAGVVVAMGWTGEWAARFTREGDALRAQAGMDLTSFILHPGEEVRSPLVALVFWTGDRLRGNNLLRRHILAHHTPRGTGSAPLSVRVLCPSWGSTPAAVHERNIRSIIEHDLPVDYYWIDAEWFGASPWWRNNGNWNVRKDAYPRGLAPLSDLLHASGRRLMLWFEPHRVCKGTAWHRDHPEWLLTLRPGDEVTSWPHWVDMDDPRWLTRESNRNMFTEGDALLDIGIPEARAFLTDAISRAITESGLDCYREDFNISPLAFWRGADAPDRKGITEIRWIEGLYAFWDELRDRHPGLIIDNCASGGRRMDLESLGRAIPLWRTDFPCDAVAAQSHALGLLPWVPLHSVGKAMVGVDDAYSLRSMMSSSLLAFFENKPDGPNPDPLPEDFPWELARRNLDAYCRIQHFWYGDFYPLTRHTTSRDAWAAYQLDRPDLGEGMVMAFRREASPFTAASLRIHGLDPSVLYEIADQDTGETVTVPGGALAADGLSVRLETAPDSALLVYRRAGSA